MDADIHSLAQYIDDEAWESMVKDGIAPEVQGNIQLLRAAAQRYVVIVEDLSYSLQAFTETLKRQKQLRHQVKDYESSEEYLKNKEEIATFLSVSQIPEKLYQESFRFQNILNEFLGQKIVMTFVYNGKEGPELYEMTSDKVLKFDYSKTNQLVARYRINKEELQSVGRNMEMDNELKFSLPGLKTTYKEVMRRYDIGRARKTNMVMWEVDDYWEKMKVSSGGDINEAYAKFILENQESPSFTLEMEQNIGDYMLQGVVLVDNVSGLLQGDVTIGNIEYGIKSAGASTLSLKQILKIARQIVSDEGFDENKLRQIKAEFQAKGRTRNKLVNVVNDTVDEIVSLIKIPNK